MLVLIIVLLLLLWTTTMVLLAINKDEIWDSISLKDDNEDNDN